MLGIVVRSLFRGHRGLSQFIFLPPLSQPASRCLVEQYTLELIERYRAGDEAAAEAMFSKYVTRLVALAQSRLSNRLSRRIDAEDIVQSAYRSFFHHARNGRFEFEQGGDLWSLLVVITLNKLRQKVEYHTAGKRRYDKEQSVENGGAYGAHQDPTPAETLAVVEEIERLTEGLDDTQKQIVEMRLQGYQMDEIATEVGRSERTVRRVMEKIRLRLERQLDDSA